MMWWLVSSFFGHEYCSYLCILALAHSCKSNHISYKLPLCYRFLKNGSVVSSSLKLVSKIFKMEAILSHDPVDIIVPISLLRALSYKNCMLIQHRSSVSFCMWLSRPLRLLPAFSSSMVVAAILPISTHVVLRFLVSSQVYLTLSNPSTT
jgi:hypothetical protein